MHLKFLLFGVDYTKLPYFMHLEAILNVPYRYKKKFSGTVFKDGKVLPIKLIHYVRNLSVQFKTNREKIGAILDGSGYVQKVNLPYGEARLIDEETVSSIVYNEYSSDKNILIELL